jgi:hypothetical protein
MDWIFTGCHFLNISGVCLDTSHRSYHCCFAAALANPGFRMSRVNCKPEVGDWCMIDLPGVFLEEDIIGTTGLAANTWRTVNLPLGVLGNQ